MKFYGFLEYEDERIVIVEHVPNGTLREHLDCELYDHILCLLFFLLLIFCNIDLRDKLS